MRRLQFLFLFLICISRGNATYNYVDEALLRIPGAQKHQGSSVIESTIVRNRNPTLFKANLQPQSVSSLSKTRESAAIDACWWGDEQGHSFSEVVESVVSELTTSPSLAFPDGYVYTKVDVMKIPKETSGQASLSQFKLCENLTTDDLTQLIGSNSKNVNAETLSRLNQFSAQMNTLDEEGKVALWSQFMGCLAEQETFRGNVTESGSTPGVHVGMDSDGFYKVGMYQFTKSASAGQSNLFECFNSWNKTIEKKGRVGCEHDFFSSNRTTLISSTGQAFNAYCGTHKILESLYVQANTTDPKRTSARNTAENGALVPSEQRCVSPVNAYSYQHFGPLKASTRNNLDQIMSCVVPSLDVPSQPSPPVLAQNGDQEETPAVENQTDEPVKTEPEKSTEPSPTLKQLEEQKIENSAALASLVVKGFGCEDYKDKVDGFVSSGGPWLDYVQVMTLVNEGIADRCKKDMSCSKRMSAYVEPLIAEITGQSQPNTYSAERAHNEARRIGYRCRW